MTTYGLPDYLGRITPWQSNHPKFTAEVSGVLAPFADAQAFIASIPASFDLDTAIGVQLDATGAWIGRDRYVSLPIPRAYFSFNVPGRGFGQGSWKGPYSGEFGIFSLDDETYRRLLRANILAKRWDGTVPGAQAAFDTFFIDPDTYVFVQDNAQVPYPTAYFAFGVIGQGFNEGVWLGTNITPSAGRVDVSMTIGVAGKIPPPVQLGLLVQNAIPIKPAGVATKYAVTTVDRAPLFGFGVQNKFVSGFGSGAWGASPEHLLGT